MKTHIINKEVSIFLLFLLNFQYCVNLNPAWETRSISYRGKSLKLITLKDIDGEGIEKLIELIDRSSESFKPEQITTKFSGIIREKDVVVINEKFIFLFSLTEKKKRSIRSGGGLLYGIWEIIINKASRKISLKQTKNEKSPISYAPNLLLPGSKPGVKLFGADIYGGYKNTKVVWGLENSLHVKETQKSGQKIFDSDRGPYSSDNGVFVEFTGILGNSGKAEGFETDYDTDPRQGIIGRTSFTLTYRIPQNRHEYIQEIKFKAEENNFGPISTAYMALYLPGYDRKSFSWVSNPELMPMDPKIFRISDNVWKNKYFRNTAVKDVFFYQVLANNKKIKRSAHTPYGKGRIICLGSPEDRIDFICGYPTNDFIPKETYQEYSLEISENQTMEKVGRFHTINYKLINNKDKEITLKKDESFIMIMRYKLIDASQAVAAIKNRKNPKESKIDGKGQSKPINKKSI
jgi:hypothetical protein